MFSCNPLYRRPDTAPVKPLIPKQSKVGELVVKGCVTACGLGVTQPLDTVKVRMQYGKTFREAVFNGHGWRPYRLFSGIGVTTLGRVPAYTGLFATRYFVSSLPSFLENGIPISVFVLTILRFETFKIVQQNGVSAQLGSNFFLRGLDAMAIREGIYAATLLNGPSMIESQLRPWFPQYPKRVQFASTVLAGLVGGLISAPFDYTRTLISVGVYPNVMRALAEELKPSKIFAGMLRGPTLLIRVLGSVSGITTASYCTHLCEWWFKKAWADRAGA